LASHETVDAGHGRQPNLADGPSLFTLLQGVRLSSLAILWTTIRIVELDTASGGIKRTAEFDSPLVGLVEVDRR
jgi:hypothetical protein